jgi:hypothetical protein
MAFHSGNALGDGQLGIAASVRCSVGGDFRGGDRRNVFCARCSNPYGTVCASQPQVIEK